MFSPFLTKCEECITISLVVSTFLLISGMGSVLWVVLVHLLYGLDLVPSDFHLFGPNKDRLGGKHFPSNDTITAAVKQ